jgi:hypothetical protein
MFILGDAAPNVRKFLLEGILTVAEPLELFQLKCLSPTLKARPHLRPCSVNPVTYGLDGIGKNREEI